MKNKGFSLVELLIALLLVTIISVVFLGIFKRGGLAWQLGERRVKSYQNARVILGQLSRELPAVYVDDRYKFIGGAAQIEFFANIWTGDSGAEGIVKLGYRKRSGENILERLYVVDPDPSLPEDWSGAIEFAFYFKSISFTYDGEGTWDSSAKNDKPPSKVEITVTMEDDKPYTTAVSIINY